MEKKYKIYNVTCQSCVNLIEKILNGMEGIEKSNVNLATEELFVKFDESQIEDEIFKNKLQMFGYKVEDIKNIKEVDFLIEGLHCQSCVATVEKIISGMNGVEKIEVNLATEKAKIFYEPEKIKLSEIFEKIKMFGYTGKKITQEILNEKELEEQKKLKIEFNEFLISIVFGVIIFYISMGSMIGMPLPKIIDYNFNPQIFAIVQLILSIPVIYVGRKFYVVGAQKLKMGAPSMDTLIALGTGAAFIYSIYSTIQILKGDIHYVHNLYFESGVIIISLISLGKYLEKKSKGKTSEAIKKLMALQSQKANLVRGNEIIEIDIEEVSEGDILLVKPGESIATDGIVIEGVSTVNESMLTGESIPVKKNINSKVFGATINGTGSLKIKVEATGENTVLSKIIRLVENAQGSKAPIAKMTDIVSGYFVPVVIVIAILSSILWYFIGSNGLIEVEEPSVFALKILISVLVIACPCSLGLATPTAIMVGTGKGAELGILIKSGEALEKAYKLDTVVFDKTGTITEGNPKVTDILVAEGIQENDLLKIAASLEINSEHPLGEAIVKEAKERKLEFYKIKLFKSKTGKGIVGKLELDSINELEIGIGNKKLMEKYEIDVEKYQSQVRELSEKGKTVIYISNKNEILGLIAIADTIKENSKLAVKELKNMGIEVIMLTGDNENTAQAIAKEVGIEKVISEVSPEDKYTHILNLQQEGKHVAMVGDGINDSPALAQASVGIAIGGGADIALESADIVLMRKDIKDVPKAIELSRATMKNIKENLFWAFIYNGIGIPVAAGVLYPFTGHLLNPMIAGGAMAMSSISVVMNALRLKWFK